MTTLAVVLPAVIACLGTLALARSPIARRLLDRPNERSLHTEVVPRVGGIALLAGALPFAFATASPTLAILLALALLLAIVSAIDDVRALPVAVRLAAHFAAAVVASMVVIGDAVRIGTLSPLYIPLAILAIAWMANLFNFMDGSDGLAGSMAAVGFGTLGMIALGIGQVGLGTACIALASASVGFLAVNWPPARVFMGDAGAVPLGFLSGALGALGWMASAWPAWFPVMVFAPFVFDATFTLLRRLARRERVWIAHREHGYQRLVLTGWNKRKLAAWSLAAMSANAAVACAALRQSGAARYAIISVLAVAWLLLLATIERRRT